MILPLRPSGTVALGPVLLASLIEMTGLLWMIKLPYTFWKAFLNPFVGEIVLAE